MLLNVQFLDSVVRGYFSLHHTVNVDVAVYTILTESLGSLKSLIEKRTEDESELSAEVKKLPLIDALFTSSDLQETLRVIPTVVTVSADHETFQMFPDIATWFLAQGIENFLRKADKPYVKATARAFGISKALSAKLPQQKLVWFITRVALDEQFHTKPEVPKSPIKSPFKQSPKREMGTSVQVPLLTQSPKTQKKPAERDEEGPARQDLRVELFSDVPLKRVAERKKRASDLTPSKGLKSPKPKKAKPSTTPIKSKSPSKVPLEQLIPTTIDKDLLINACAGYRQIPNNWLNSMPAEIAWKLLFVPGRLSPEELRQYRLPIGEYTSDWQLQQWFFAGELQAFCTEHNIRVKKNKKSAVISHILKHTRATTTGVERQESRNESSMSQDVEISQKSAALDGENQGVDAEGLRMEGEATRDGTQLAG